MSLLSIIVPCYNEEEVINETYQRLCSIFPKLDMETEVIFIDDGSSDTTLLKLYAIAEQNKDAKVISLSRNFGHQIAITAGIDYSRGDAVVIIDADLQDPVEVILEMAQKWREGYEVAYGKRIKREGESIFKKLSAHLFYKIINKLADQPLPVDVGDFRLMDRMVCNALKNMPERSRYLRGLVAWLGFKVTFVEYVREPRYAGETKYSFYKMLKLAIDGIISFSYKPLRLASFLGSLISAGSFIYLAYVLYQGLFTENTITGWTSTMAVLLFFNGIILVVLGITGEYVARIYEEAKARPIYVVRETIN